MFVGKTSSLVDLSLARKKDMRLLAEEDCIKSPVYYDTNEGMTQNIMTDMDCDETYYKCASDQSEGCRTVTSGVCDDYLGYSCMYTTYFDDPIGQDRYWSQYGSSYNATYWEYYNGETGEMSYNNVTEVCDEDCKKEFRDTLNAVGTGAAVIGGIWLLWIALMVCCPICIILIVVCCICKCMKEAMEEPEPRKDEVANAGETSVPATAGETSAPVTVEMQQQPM